jgi:hypothetical protein
MSVVATIYRLLEDVKEKHPYRIGQRLAIALGTEVYNSLKKEIEESMTTYSVNDVYPEKFAGHDIAENPFLENYAMVIFLPIEPITSEVISFGL